MFSFALSSPAAAQAEAAIVNIPFQFIVGDRVLPAGSYRIAPQKDDWSLVAINSLSEKVAVFVTTVSLGKAEPVTSTSEVKFAKHAGQYFLSEVAVPGMDARLIRVTPGQAQRTLAKLNLLNAEPANVAK